jgi:hypothetical protein
MDVEKLEANIGKKCKKRPLDDRNIGKYKLKPFKSGNKVNTIKGVIPHPNLEGLMAYTFEEDESYVECRRCEIIVPKITIKTKEEIFQLEPIKQKGHWWRAYVSNIIFLSFWCIPLFSLSLIISILGSPSPASMLLIVTIISILLFSMFLMDNIGPVFSDKYVNIHYYKKRKEVWNKWWHETSRHIQYLEYKKKYEKK